MGRILKLRLTIGVTSPVIATSDPAGQYILAASSRRQERSDSRVKVTKGWAA